MPNNVTCEINGNIATITLAAPDSKVNILNSEFMSELEQTAHTLGNNNELRGAIVISGQPAGFIAGADIDEFENVTDPQKGAALAASGQHVFNLWEALPFPVIAAIHGHCMGGGTEFSLACHYRIATESTLIALPEVKLGILPGFGGTQRLPRLISLERSLDLILSGRSIRSSDALKAGLIDRLVDDNSLKNEANDFLTEIITDNSVVLSQRKKKSGGWRRMFLEKIPIGRRFLFRNARQQLLKKTGGHYPAPLKALEIIEEGLALSMKAGLELEANALGEMIVTPVSKNLVHLFHLSQRPKKIAGQSSMGHVIKKVAVLGAGIMGGGIAQLLASRGITTILKDINQQALETGIEHARNIFKAEQQKKRYPDAAIEKKMALLTTTLVYDQFADVDLVIEAVVEKLPIKQAVLRETEPHLPLHALFASNTSALSISELQESAQRMEQIGGLHFFNPVDKMPLIEIVRGRQTSDEAANALFQFAINIGKIPIITSDKSGFLVNRLLVTYLLEAALTATEGVNWRSIDKLMTDFGYPMGPFRLVDEVGMDIAVEVGETLCQAFNYLQPTDLLHKILNKGLLGKKGGSGFYNYINGHSEGVNLAIETVIPATERLAGHTELKRLMYLMVNEAGRCLEEGVVAAPEDIDTGMVFGTGFPPFHGGLCRWADAEGFPGIIKTLKAFASQHGDRFAPCDYLKERSRFYL